MSAEAQLEALLEIINTSARQAIAEYKKVGNDVPTIHSKGYHPLDSATDTVALKKAMRLLEGSCQQLCASLAPPQHTFHSLAKNFEFACVRVAIRAKVADALESYPEGLHFDQLAKLVNLEKGKLARVLRLLASKGCFTEVKPNVFANNRISLMALSGCDAAALSLFEAQDVTPGALVLYESMSEPDWAESYHPDKAPLMHALEKKGVKGDFFDWIKQDAEERDRYHCAMKGIGTITGALSVLNHYPWNEIETVCDVGSSIGTFSQPLAKAFPHLKITDQDLPEVLARAKDVWAKDAPEVLQRNQVEFVPLNFFEESPVKGQDAYYLRNIIHDWPDAEAAIILRNVRNAMAPHSRLLIHDLILPPVSRDLDAASAGAEIAPEPLLPNFGHGNNVKYQQDVNMLIIHNAKERTLDDSMALGSAAGLRLEKVYDLGETTVLEFRLAAYINDGRT